MNTKRYTPALFGLLTSLAKYLLGGGVIGTLLLGFLNREILFNNGIDGLIGGILAYLLIGCIFGIVAFCFKGLNSDTLAFLGEQFGFGFSLATFGGSTGFMWFVLFMLKILFYMFQGLIFMPVLIVYLAIMSVIERFAEIPESIGNLTDHLPKIASVALAIVLVLICLNAVA